MISRKETSCEQSTCESTVKRCYFINKLIILLRKNKFFIIGDKKLVHNWLEDDLPGQDLPNLDVETPEIKKYFFIKFYFHFILYQTSPS